MWILPDWVKQFHRKKKFSKESILNKIKMRKKSAALPLDPGAKAALLMAYVLRQRSKVSSQRATTPSFPPVTNPWKKKKSKS